MKHHPPDWDNKFGYSEIFPDRLYLGGEDDIDDLLYGVTEARNLNGKGTFLNGPATRIDCWIDLRDHRPSNRIIYIPKEVEYLSFPFQDGNYEEATQVLPEAKAMLTQRLREGKRVVVTCHQGMSRSALLILWHLSEELSSFQQAWALLKEKRYIVKPDKKFTPFLEKWSQTYG